MSSSQLVDTGQAHYLSYYGSGRGEVGGLVMTVDGHIIPFLADVLAGVSWPVAPLCGVNMSTGEATSMISVMSPGKSQSFAFPMMGLSQVSVRGIHGRGTIRYEFTKLFPFTITAKPLDTTEAALRAAMANNPGDPGPRLVLADYLEERGRCREAELLRKS